MGLYNFKPQFVPFILDGSKTHTIRGERAHPDDVGATMHLYTGLRQKGARLLLRAPCVRVEEIAIHEVRQGLIRIILDGQGLAINEIAALAYRDGFRPALSPVTPTAIQLMAEFWRDRLPFWGHVYHWGAPR